MLCLVDPAALLKRDVWAIGRRSPETADRLRELIKQRLDSGDPAASPYVIGPAAMAVRATAAVTKF